MACAWCKIGLDTCPICGAAPETKVHLLWDCVNVKEVWQLCNMHTGMSLCRSVSDWIWCNIKNHTLVLHFLGILFLLM